MSRRPCPSVAAIEPPLIASRYRRPAASSTQTPVAAHDDRVGPLELEGEHVRLARLDQAPRHAPSSPGGRTTGPAEAGPVARPKRTARPPGEGPSRRSPRTRYDRAIGRLAALTGWSGRPAGEGARAGGAQKEEPGGERRQGPRGLAEGRDRVRPVRAARHARDLALEDDPDRPRRRLRRARVSTCTAGRASSTRGPTSSPGRCTTRRSGTATSCCSPIPRAPP